MDMKDIRREYLSLEKKYKLPEFKKIFPEFELNSIDDGTFFLRSVRRRMYSKTLFFTNILEAVLFPSGQSSTTSYESGFFSPERKLELMHTHKLLMTYARKSLSLDVSSTDAKEAQYIHDLFSVWPPIRKDLLAVVNDMSSCWQREAEKEHGGYFG